MPVLSSQKGIKSSETPLSPKESTENDLPVMTPEKTEISTKPAPAPSLENKSGKPQNNDL
jgi:hypothetical protein